jgi:hypothetical protein
MKHTMPASEGVEVKLHKFLTSALDAGEWLMMIMSMG